MALPIIFREKDLKRRDEFTIMLILNDSNAVLLDDEND